MKTSELTGATLDWAVAKCEGLPLKLDPMGFRKDSPASMQAGWWVWDGEGQNQIIGHRKNRRGEEDGYSPSTNWAQGGPIIERADINVNRHTHSEITESRQEIYRKDGWTAFSTPTAYWMTPTRAFGPTPLIAAMRCYVASRLGDEVEIPKELA